MESYTLIAENFNPNMDAVQKNLDFLTSKAFVNLIMKKTFRPSRPLNFFFKSETGQIFEISDEEMPRSYMPLAGWYVPVFCNETNDYQEIIHIDSNKSIPADFKKGLFTIKNDFKTGLSIQSVEYFGTYAQIAQDTLAQTAIEYNELTIKNSKKKWWTFW